MKPFSICVLAVCICVFVPFNAFASDADSTCSIKQCHAGQKVWIEGANRRDAYFACETSPLSDYMNGMLGLLGIQAIIGVQPQISKITGEPIYEGESEEMITLWRERAGVQSFYQAEKRCKHIVTNGRKVAATIISIPDLNRQNTLDYNAAFVQIGGKMRERYWLPYAYLQAVR